MILRLRTTGLLTGGVGALGSSRGFKGSENNEIITELGE